MAEERGSDKLHRSAIKGHAGDSNTVFLHIYWLSQTRTHTHAQDRNRIFLQSQVDSYHLGSIQFPQSHTVLAYTDKKQCLVSRLEIIRLPVISVPYVSHKALILLITQTQKRAFIANLCTIWFVFIIIKTGF